MLEKHFSVRFEKLGDDEHGDFPRWRGQILGHVRLIAGAEAALLDGAAITAIAAPAAIGELPVRTPAQFWQQIVRSFIVGNLKAGSNAEKLVRALPHASGLLAGGGEQQVWQKLEARYYIPEPAPSPFQLQNKIAGLKWPKAVSAAGYKERVSKLRGFAEELGDFPIDDAAASQLARGRLWQYLAIPTDSAAQWHEIIHTARNRTNNELKDGVGTMAQLMRFIAAVEEAADEVKPAPRALAARLDEVLAEACADDDDVVSRVRGAMSVGPALGGVRRTAAPAFTFAHQGCLDECCLGA